MSRAALAAIGALLQAGVVFAPAALARGGPPPAASLVLAAVVGLATVLEIAVQDQRGDRAMARGIDAWLARVSGGMLLATIVAASIEAATAAAGPSPLVMAFGAAIVAAGAALRAGAIVALGSRFVAPAVASGARRETGGVYRLFRHPSEVGLLVVGLGASVTCNSGVAFALCALLVPATLLRCRREEAALAARFGSVG